MAEKQLVPFSFEDKVVVPFEKKAKPLASLPPDHLPLLLFLPSRPRSPPPPTESRQALYAYSYDRRREAAQKKPICVPSYMDLKKPREGERLVDVRMDKHGNTRVHKYTTSSSCVPKNLRSREFRSSKPASICRRNRRPRRP
jgi:hypothetical protein